MRRIVTIIIIAFVLIGASLGAYIIFFANRAPVVVVPPGSVSSFPITNTKTPVVGTQVTSITESSTTIKISSVASSTLPKFIKITSGPVSPGVVVFDSTTTPIVVNIRYINRKSGNMYDYNVQDTKLIRISNKTIPGVESVSWLPDGSMAYLQYFSPTKSLETYALPANGSGGFSLPQGISDIATYLHSALLTLASGSNGSVATRSLPNYTKTVTAFQTPLTKIFVQFAGLKNYLVYTKAAASINGYAFLINRATGSFSRIAGPLHGLVALAGPNGKNIIVSYVDSTGLMHMSLINIKTRSITPLPIVTIASKCVWASSGDSVYCGIPTNPPKAIYPDDWYQGAVPLNGTIWKIDVTSHYAKFILNPAKEGGETIDATSLAIDPAENILSFINKDDGSLWALRL